ncbi:MAG: hypothetical protein ACTHYO_14355 [Micrococcaceae bacterium]
MTRTTRSLTLSAVAVAVVALAGCSTEDTGASEPTFHPSAIEVAGGQVSLPDGAWAAAETSSGQCPQVSTELVVGKIAATSGYDADFSDAHGGAGYSGMYPEKWATFGTGELGDRADLEAGTQATAAELCESYDIAEQLSDEGAEGSVDDIALSVSLVGERYTRDEGLVDVDAEVDPHDVRAQITEITDAAASVAT